MSGSATSVPPPTWTAQGFVIPAESDILAGVNADMNAAFGGNLNVGTADGTPTNATPQGQLAASLTAIIGDKDAQFQFYSQQVDPAYASGRMQDGIARIYFITRNPAQSTLVTATCTGRVNLTIPAGASAQATDGNIYLNVNDGTIPASGSIALQFQCVTAGPISCAAGSLNAIYRMIPGWDTINNAADGILGRNVETRAQFEARRRASVAKNSMGMLASITGAVYAVSGVLDAFCTENPTKNPVVTNGVTIAPNSIYVAASGGADADVANAIWSKKSPGCGYTPGTTTIAVQDTNSGYAPPLPSYNVTFTRPTSVPIFFSVGIVNSLYVPADALTEVSNAIIAAFAGNDGGMRVARIGATVYASRFYGPIASLGTWAQIVSLQIGTGPGAVFTASIATTTLTVTAVASGTIAVGMLVTGASVAQASIIQSQLTGTTGGVGTYRLNTTQTVVSETMNAIPLGNTITVQANQIPTTAAPNVNLLLM
jgi:hypothetical protein